MESELALGEERPESGLDTMGSPCRKICSGKVLAPMRIEKRMTLKGGQEIKGIE